MWLLAWLALRNLTSQQRHNGGESVAVVVGHVLLNDVGSRPGPIEEGHFVVGDAGSGRVLADTQLW